MKEGTYTREPVYGDSRAFQEYVTSSFITSSIKEPGAPGTLNTYPGGAGNRAYTDLCCLQDLLGNHTPYYPVALSTAALKNDQIATISTGNTAQVYFENGKMKILAGKNPKGQRWDNGRVLSKSCLYTAGLAYGCGLLLAQPAADGQAWGASVSAFQPGTISGNMDLGSLLAFGTATPPPEQFWGVIAINRLYNTEQDARDMAADILQSLDRAGVPAEQITIYQSFSTGNTNLSLGIDSTGKWGETLDEL